MAGRDGNGHGRRPIRRWALLAAACLALAGGVARAEGLTVAFVGDQSSRQSARDVLDLVVRGGADLLVLGGDLGYSRGPVQWIANMDELLGPDFPVLAVVGNHEEDAWPVYQRWLERRIENVDGLDCDGEVGVKARCTFRGLSVVQVAPGVHEVPGVLPEDGYPAFVADALADDPNPWRICSWHKLQRRMQVELKTDATGWGVYQECLAGGGIVATAHAHVYARTFLMDDFENQGVVHRNDHLEIGPGRSFAFVSGLGGKEPRVQARGGDWWASIHTATQGATHGALFCTFETRTASCRFEDIAGAVIDRFTLESANAPETDVAAETTDTEERGADAEPGTVAGADEDADEDVEDADGTGDGGPVDEIVDGEPAGGSDGAGAETSGAETSVVDETRTERPATDATDVADEAGAVEVTDGAGGADDSDGAGGTDGESMDAERDATPIDAGRAGGETLPATDGSGAGDRSAPTEGDDGSDVEDAATSNAPVESPDTTPGVASSGRSDEAPSPDPVPLVQPVDSAATAGNAGPFAVTADADRVESAAPVDADVASGIPPEAEAETSAPSAVPAPDGAGEPALGEALGRERDGEGEALGRSPVAAGGPSSAPSASSAGSTGAAGTSGPGAASASVVPALAAPTAGAAAPGGVPTAVANADVPVATTATGTPTSASSAPAAVPASTDIARGGAGGAFLLPLLLAAFAARRR